jgi:hypothetical protein
MSPECLTRHILCICLLFPEILSILFACTLYEKNVLIFVYLMVSIVLVLSKIVIYYVKNKQLFAVGLLVCMIILLTIADMIFTSYFSIVYMGAKDDYVTPNKVTILLISTAMKVVMLFIFCRVRSQVSVEN